MVRRVCVNGRNVNGDIKFSSDIIDGIIDSGVSEFLGPHVCRTARSGHKCGGSGEKLADKLCISLGIHLFCRTSVVWLCGDVLRRGFGGLT